MNILITGGTDGIGLALAKRFLNLDYNVFIIGKNFEKGNSIITKIKKPNLTFFQCDLSEKKEIKRLIKQLNNLSHLDILINNAGAIFDKRVETSDGIEKTFALNHLSYFHLSIGLKNLIEKSRNGKIINISSNAHKRYKLNLNDLENKNEYNGWKAYCHSKLLNIYLTYFYKKKLKTKINCNCLHPGFVNSNFGNNNKSIYRFAVEVLKKIIGISNEEASKAPFELALSKNYEGINGKYFFKTIQKKSSIVSYDKEIGELVWKKSLDYIN